MQGKRVIIALALAVAVTGSSTGFVLPVSGNVLGSTVAGTPWTSHVSTEVMSTNIAAAKVNQKKVTTNNLNLRQGKSTGTKVLLTIPKNTKVTITETSGSWSKTSYKSKTGWVTSQYLKNVPTSNTTTYRYTTGFTVLRKSASAKSASLSAHQRRAKVQYISASGAWVKVKTSNKTGYMQKSELSTTMPALVNRWLKSKQTVYKSTSNTSAKVITLAKGTKVEWLRTVGSWNAIRTSKGNGFVPASTLSKTASLPSTPKVTYRWTTANVNVRKGAGTSYASLGTISANSKVTYLKTSKSWSNVKTAKGTGWISNAYLSTDGQHSFAVYGTLRKGQSAYYLLKGKTTKETKTTVASHSMYLQPGKTWLSYVIPSKKASDTVVVERMDIKPSVYRSTVVDMDKWERYDPKKPKADQNYNRVMVTDKQGKKSWVYLGSTKIGKYLTKNGIRVISGDYLKRF